MKMVRSVWNLLLSCKGAVQNLNGQIGRTEPKKAWTDRLIQYK